MKRYVGKHEMYQRGPDRESIAIITIIFVTIFCLFCSVGMLIPVRAVEPDMASEIVEIPMMTDDPEPIAKQERLKDYIPQVEYIPTFEDVYMEYVDKARCQFSKTDLDLIAKCSVGEYDNLSNYGQSSAVVWCVLNYIDAGYGEVSDILTPGRFSGMLTKKVPTQQTYELVTDVVARWLAEKDGWTSEEVGRTLPRDFLWFTGNHPDRCNHFRNNYNAPYDVYIP